MTAFLPPNLLALFAAKDPIPYLPPVDKLGFEKKRLPFGGVAAFLQDFEDPKDTPPPTRVETKEERKERKRKERAEQIAYKLEQDLALWDPNNTKHADTEDPYKTLFVARINFDTSESKLRREFEVFGPVRKIKLVHDTMGGKPRGYAFIEYEHEGDMHSAYKHADGKKIDGRRVLVDVERGRTVKGWRPRRLGGGLGGTRKGGPDENSRFSGRDEFREREVSRERDRRGRRSRSRDREREPRRRRSRSRERRRSRSRERNRGGREEEDRVERKRGRRSRSRDREREKRRSRSRDRKKSRRSRSRDRRREPEDENYDSNDMSIKQEKETAGYPEVDNNGYGFQEPFQNEPDEEEEGEEGGINPENY